MQTRRQPRSSSSIALVLLAVLLLLGSISVIVSTAQDIDIGIAPEAEGLSTTESAYYEYVAPRLDRLIEEVDDVVVMVEGKSRDILALTISGSRIEQLSGEIVDYGEEHGVPDRFTGLHATIVDATETANFTFGQARESLRSFEFSRMTSLVTEFQDAAAGLHRAHDELETLAGGTGSAERSVLMPARRA